MSNHRKDDHELSAQIPTDVTLELSCYNCDDTFSSLNTLNEHNATKHQNSCYGGGNMFDDIHVHVITMSIVEEQQEHPAESTRMTQSVNFEESSASCDICGCECASDTLLLLHINGNHKEKADFNCTDSSYAAGSIDEMIMHENMAHTSLSVTTIENAVEDIIDLPLKRKRKQESSNIPCKKLKYRLYL